MLGRLSQFIIGILCVTTLVSAAAFDTRLSNAAMDGDSAAVEALLKQNVDVNAAQGDGTTALHWAAYRDDLKMAQMLIEAGADLEVKTRLGEFTPLFMASRNGSADMIGLFLKEGANPNATNAQGSTPLMMVAAAGNPDAVKAILNAGVDVNARESAFGQTATMFAAALNRADAVRLLAASGADVNAVSQPQPLYVNGQNDPAQQNRNRAPRANRGNPSTLGGSSALHMAARGGHLDAIKALVESGADVNTLHAEDKMTAMTEAILNSHFDVGKYLLDHGTDPNLASASGLTPLYATIDARYANRTWYPPLSTEQQQVGHIDLMKAIIAKGADVNAKITSDLWFRKFGGGGGDASGATAFWRAAQANDIEVMQLLVGEGADPTISSTAGVSPLQVAAGFGISHQGTVFVPDSRLASVRYLIDELGLDVNARDSRGYTPLHGVALVGDIRIIKYLVAMGADVKARAGSITGREEGQDQDVAAGAGDTVADYANGPGMNARVYPEAIELLLSLGSEFSDNCRASVCVLKARPDTARPDQQ